MQQGMMSRLNQRVRVAMILRVLLGRQVLVRSFGYSAPETAWSSRNESSKRGRHDCRDDMEVAACNVDELTRHPMVGWDASTSLQKARKKLQPRHRKLFETSSATVFDKFSAVLCETGVMPRKEVFETWSAALYIHSRFFQDVSGGTRRVCDVAAGHGLLAWALLVLDDHYYSRTKHNPDCGSSQGMTMPLPLTALCVDRRMPDSAESVRSAMIRRWPHLEERFDFVEGWLEQIRPHPTCLLASVHACGGLSDTLVSCAANSLSPIALVPCCHSRKKKALSMAPLKFAPNEYDAIINAGSKMPDLARRLDEAREIALRNAGFATTTVFLPEIFTVKNRLIMASPLSRARPDAGGSFAAEKPHPRLFQPGGFGSTSRPCVGRMVPPGDGHTSRSNESSRSFHLNRFSILCEDTIESRSKIKELSGRVNADRRRIARHRKNYSESPVYDISIWLPRHERQAIVTEKALSELASSMDINVHCSAVALGDEFLHSATGRRAQTYRLTYKYRNKLSATNGVNTTSHAILTDEDAKTVHDKLYERIPTRFPGADCR